MKLPLGFLIGLLFSYHAYGSLVLIDKDQSATLNEDQLQELVIHSLSQMQNEIVTNQEVANVDLDLDVIVLGLGLDFDIGGDILSTGISNVYEFHYQEIR